MARLKFRQLHRQLALIVFLPLALTVITGVSYQIATTWLNIDTANVIFLLDIHTGSFLGLEKIYPVLNGLGVIAMLITGLTMTSLFRRPRLRE